MLARTPLRNPPLPWTDLELNDDDDANQKLFENDQKTRKYLLSIIPEKVCDALDAEALLVLHLGGVRGGGGRVEEAGHVVGDGLEAVALRVGRLPGAQHRGHPEHGQLGNL